MNDQTPAPQPPVDENSLIAERRAKLTALRGQGIGDQLVQAAIATIKERGMKAAITCSYVKAWFNKHPEEADMLA